MKLTIKNSFIPLFFRKKIFLNNKPIGNLSATNLIGQFKGNESYQASIRKSKVQLIETKRVNKRRTWDIIVQEGGEDSYVNGRLTMESGIKDTMRESLTKYKVQFNNKKYYVTTPFMTFKGVKEAHISDKYAEEIAHLTSSYARRPLFQTHITMDSEKSYKDVQIALFTILLNLVIFVS